MAVLSLLSLPVELQRAIFIHLDGLSLSCVSDTCCNLREVANDRELWMKLVCARYRVSQRVIQSRRLQANGGVSWKTLYMQWDICQRMPMSRISGPSFPPIVKARYRNTLMWSTVCSSDDCRLFSGNILRLRIILQNIDPTEQLVVKPNAAKIITHENEIMRFETRQIIVERNNGKKEAENININIPDGHNNNIINNNNNDHVEVRLNKDEFAIMRLHVKIENGERFEIDALEQLREIQLPISYYHTQTRCTNTNNSNNGPCLVRGPLLLDYINKQRTTTLKAEFRQKTILDMYTFVSGFWLRR